jgi:hypothetical protein
LSCIKTYCIACRQVGAATDAETEMDDRNSGWKTFAEELEVSGKHLLAEVNRLIAEGNVRKLVVKSDDGHVFLTLPLTAGAVAGGILTPGRALAGRPRCGRGARGEGEA